MREDDIIRSQGLDPAPSQTSPPSPDAEEAWQRYRDGVVAYERFLVQIASYLGAQLDAVSHAEVLALLGQVTRLASEVYHLAYALGAFPNSAIRYEKGIAMLQRFADAAGAAYHARMEEIGQLETRVAAGVDWVRTNVTPGTLRLHEHYKGGHLIGKHIGKTLQDLVARSKQARKPHQRFSTFFDRSTAENTIGRALLWYHRYLISLPEGKEVRLYWTEVHDVGFVIEQGQPPRPTKSYKLVVFRDSSHPLGYRILTAKVGERKGKEI